jgi:hypothetical protein
MKKKPRIHPWSPEIRPPLLPPINMIFEMKNDNKIFTDSALLYQGILKYGIEHNNGFLFTEVGNKLIETIPEFRNYYTGAKAHIRKSARLANRRNRIRDHIFGLIAMELLYVKAMKKAGKNEEDIPLYDLTTEGRLVAWIMEGRDPDRGSDFMWLIEDRKRSASSEGNINKSEDEEKRTKAVKQVFEIVDTFTQSKESFVLTFLSVFFKEVMSRKRFADIIDFFYHSLRHYEIAIGQQVIRLFTKINHPLHWIFPFPEVFVRALDVMNVEAKNFMLLQFKLEIEEYYNKCYLVSYVSRIAYEQYHTIESRYSVNKTVPGKEWQLMRINNISNYNNVVVPSFCYKCQTEYPLVVSIYDYLTHLAAFDSGKTRPMSKVITSKCVKCNKRSLSSRLYVPLDMVGGHEAI